MKSCINIQDGILPLSKFRQDAKSILKKLQATHEPMVLTQNGLSAAVVMAPEDYDRFRYQLEFYRAVAQGESDLLQGRVTPHDKVFEDLLK